MIQRVMILLLLITSCKQAATEDATTDIQTPVSVINISRGPMQEYIELNATSTFLLKSFIKANATGYLQSTNIHLGQLVHRGQLLFTVKTKEAVSIGNAVNALDSSFKFSGTNSIKASVDGYITSLDHQPGDYVQDGEQLATISNNFVFLMNMPYELHNAVIIHHTVDLILPGGEKITGTISAAMPTVDSVAQTQSIIITMDGNKTIPENLVVKVNIPTVSKTDVITLPKSAVLADETQTEFWVMKLMNDSTAIKVPVKKGIETKDKIEIISPVFSDNDKILVTGNYGLEDTAKVKIINP
ncbi:HlyD family secretion protein [Chitinophaga sp. YR573]|uniref:efflux RND transporter periplasmic adaptor subunit n=1 Tax=Chitinophaga sp. YR573 TaxID=1881040 RepID=UPI0008D80F9E|nr:HlyD family efflux transporter periplasmic adaptor subunit [Chitinophaga sp. YR573]SEW22410.1 HlyD family secretion protein [Chitinophaga sp. YR573]